MYMHIKKNLKKFFLVEPPLLLGGSPYTDGFLQRFSIDNKIHTSHGFGWLILAEDNNTILTEFNAASKAWPLSTRMKLLAVLTLVSILPQHLEITIHTDSNNVITKFEKFKGNITFR